jgi:hypothetical protein
VVSADSVGMELNLIGISLFPHLVIVLVTYNHNGHQRNQPRHQHYLGVCVCMLLVRVIIHNYGPRYAFHVLNTIRMLLF